MNITWHMDQQLWLFIKVQIQQQLFEIYGYDTS